MAHCPTQAECRQPSLSLPEPRISLYFALKHKVVLLFFARLFNTHELARDGTTVQLKGRQCFLSPRTFLKAFLPFRMSPASPSPHRAEPCPSALAAVRPGVRPLPGCKHTVYSHALIINRHNHLTTLSSLLVQFSPRGQIMSPVLISLTLSMGSTPSALALFLGRLSYLGEGGLESHTPLFQLQVPGAKRDQRPRIESCYF